MSTTDSVHVAFLQSIVGQGPRQWVLRRRPRAQIRRRAVGGWEVRDGRTVLGTTTIAGTTDAWEAAAVTLRFGQSTTMTTTMTTTTTTNRTDTMKAYTYLGPDRYTVSTGQTTTSLYDGHDHPQCEGTVDEVVAYLESLLAGDANDIDAGKWDGRNGTYYDGAEAVKAIQEEILSLRDGSHPSLQAED